MGTEIRAEETVMGTETDQCRRNNYGHRNRSVLKKQLWAQKQIRAEETIMGTETDQGCRNTVMVTETDQA